MGLPKKTKLPTEEIVAIRERVTKAIAPLKLADQTHLREIGTTRTKAGYKLPKYYLVYFLLVDLLKFPHGGRAEKIAWTIPVEYEGSFALIEHRKLGLGVFSAATAEEEFVAERIVRAIKRGVKIANPFFDHLAAEAVHRSKLNVRNNSSWLFNRYEYLRDQFRDKAASAESRKGEVKKTEKILPDGKKTVESLMPAFALRREAEWVGIAAVDAFFSWTEHVLIHIAILRGRLKTGEEVADLAAAEWSEKVKTAIGLSDEKVKLLFDELLTIRRQIRDYMAHGAFGKQGEAFQFHSSAGAVPVNLTSPDGRDSFSMWHGGAIHPETVAWRFGASEGLYSGRRLPLILTYASDGTYDRAMSSVENMEYFIEGLLHEMDNPANMDW